MKPERRARLADVAPTTADFHDINLEGARLAMSRVRAFISIFASRQMRKKLPQWLASWSNTRSTSSSLSGHS